MCAFSSTHAVVELTLWMCVCVCVVVPNENGIRLIVTAVFMIVLALMILTAQYTQDTNLQQRDEEDEDLLVRVYVYPPGGQTVTQPHDELAQQPKMVIKPILYVCRRFGMMHWDGPFCWVEDGC